MADTARSVEELIALVLRQTFQIGWRANSPAAWDGQHMLRERDDWEDHEWAVKHQSNVVALAHLASEHQQMKEALVKFGWHLEDCEKLDPRNPKFERGRAFTCTCGFSAALASGDPAPAPTDKGKG